MHESRFFVVDAMKRLKVVHLAENIDSFPQASGLPLRILCAARCSPLGNDALPDLQVRRRHCT
jgi:hypothetical protein